MRGAEKRDCPRMRRLLFRFMNALAKRRLAPFGVIVDPSSRIEWRRISWRPGCKLRIGAGCQIEARIVFDRDGAEIKIGDRCFIGPGTLVCAERIEIGDDVMISWDTVIVDHNSHAINARDRRGDVERWIAGLKDWSKVKRAPVLIRGDAWIGFGATIMPGVTVGRGAIVGATSLVIKDVPDYAIVAAPPAQVIRMTDPLPA
jgi:acetyltransferase-like isoleucine patch superfamily enzyme